MARFAATAAPRRRSTRSSRRASDGWSDLARRLPAREHRSLTLAVGFLVIVAITGGASRGDELAQVFVRLASLAVVGLLLLGRPKITPLAVRPGLIMLALASALIALQLIPLPWALWTALPGREMYARTDSLVGVGELWRPISLAPDRTWNALLSLMVPLAMLCVLARLNQRQRAALLPWVLGLIGLGVLLMLLQLAVGGTWLIYAPVSTQPPAGLFQNRNHQALMLVFGLPLLAIWANGPGRLSPSLKLMIAAGAVATLLVFTPATGSRAGLVLGAASLVMTFPLVWRAAAERLGRVRRRQRRPLLIGAGIATVVVLLIGLGFSRAVSVQRLMSLNLADDVRRQLFPRVVEMGRTFFPVGSGAGSFDPAFRRFEQLGDLKTTYFNQAHNDVAQLLIEGGLLFWLLLGAGLAWLARRMVVVWRRPGDRSATRLSRAASVCILLVFFASFVDYPLRTPLHMALLALFSVWLFDDPRERSEEVG